MPSTGSLRVPARPQTRLPANVLSAEIGVGDVRLHVADLARACAFYCDLLGLDVTVHHPSFGAPTVRLADRRQARPKTTIVGEDERSERTARYECTRLVGVVYPDAAALDQVLDRLVAAEYSVELIDEDTAEPAALLSDPSGTSLTLSYRPSAGHADRSADRDAVIYETFVFSSLPFDRWRRG